LAGVLGGIVTSVATLLYTDLARRRERRADREDKDRAERQLAREQQERASQAYRTDLIHSLLPAILFLAEYPPAENANDEEIKRYIARLSSESMQRAREAIELVGLVYPSPKAQEAAGYVGQTVRNVIMLQEQVLNRTDAGEDTNRLRIAARLMRAAETNIRDLAREIRGPLPWELEGQSEQSQHEGLDPP
jgi:hypothetical protein